MEIVKENDLDYHKGKIRYRFDGTSTNTTSLAVEIPNNSNARVQVETQSGTVTVFHTMDETKKVLDGTAEWHPSAAFNGISGYKTSEIKSSVHFIYAVGTGTFKFEVLQNG